MVDKLRISQKKLTTKQCPVVFPEMKHGTKVQLSSKSSAQNLRENFYLINLKERKLFDNRELLSKVGCALEEKKTRDQVYGEIVDEYQTEIDKGLMIAKQTGLLYRKGRSAFSLFDVICENTTASTNPEPLTTTRLRENKSVPFMSPRSISVSSEIRISDYARDSIFMEHK